MDDVVAALAKMVLVVLAMALVCLLGAGLLVVVFWQVVRFALWSMGLVDG